MRKTIVFVITIVISTILTVVALEIIGRVIIHINHAIPGKTYSLWKYDPELGSTHRNNAYNTHTSLNNHGFRNREDIFNPKPKNSLRILAFGGSTTFGYNLKDNETFTHKLEEKLRQIPKLKNTQVLNAGRITYSIGHNLILMKRLIPELKPDYVIIYEGVNEIMNGWSIRKDGISLDELKEYGVIGGSYDRNRWLKRNSVIVRFIDYRVKAQIAKFYDKTPLEIEGIDIHPWLIENYKFLLNKILNFLKSKNITPIVIRYASIKDPEQRVFSDASAEIARENRTIIYDMELDFKDSGVNPENLFIYTGVHVTPLGAEMMAEGLYQIIMKDLRIKNENSTRSS